MEKTPKISFIICTFDYPEVSDCLDSVLKQEYKGEKEILIMEAGSNKETLRVLDSYRKKYSNIKIIKNKEKLPEGQGRGKWLGWKKSGGKFVAIVDQDNVLKGEDWLKKMIKPFEDPKISGVLSRLSIEKNDPLINQYVALQGTDPFLSYMSLDGILNLKKLKKEKSYHVIKMDKKCPVITGGNCFIYRKKHLDEVGGYIRDTENIIRLLEKGHDKFAIPFAYTHHKATSGFFNFLKKKKSWAKSYDSSDQEKGFNYLPKTKEERKRFLINIFSISFLVPRFFVSLKKILETKQKVWILHAPMGFITTLIYFRDSFLGKLFQHF